MFFSAINAHQSVLIECCGIHLLSSDTIVNGIEVHIVGHSKKQPRLRFLMSCLTVMYNLLVRWYVTPLSTLPASHAFAHDCRNATL